MKQKTGSRREKIRFKIVKEAISTRKIRKAGDKAVCKEEWLIEEGEKLIKSLEILFNKIEQNK